VQDRNDSVMEASGLGLLPGICLAMLLVVFAMAGLMLGSWWVVFACLALLLLVTVIIVGVVFVVMDDSEERRRHIPGLGPRAPRAS
jgi:membrane protein implicated in regulation of membrane protease activity